MRETMRAKETVLGWIKEDRAERRMAKGPKPNENPKKAAPKKKALPSDTFFLIAISIKTKTIEILSMAGTCSKNVISVSFHSEAPIRINVHK